jgi:hypothetical protein
VRPSFPGGRRVAGFAAAPVPSSATVSVRRVRLDSAAAPVWSSWQAWAVLPAGVMGGGGGWHLQIQRRPGQFWRLRGGGAPVVAGAAAGASVGAAVLAGGAPVEAVVGVWRVSPMSDEGGGRASRL